MSMRRSVVLSLLKGLKLSKDTYSFFKEWSIYFPYPILLTDEKFHILFFNEIASRKCKIDGAMPHFLESHLKDKQLSYLLSFKQRLSQNFYAHTEIALKNLGDVNLIGHRFEKESQTRFTLMLIPLSYKTPYRLLQKKYNIIMKYISDSVIITDEKQKILETNRAFSEITGYSSEEAKGRFPTLLKSKKHDDEFYQKLYKDINEFGHFTGELTDRRKNGELMRTRSTISPLYDDNGVMSNYVGILQDVTEIKSIQNKIINTEYKDILTGVQNRESFLNILNLKCELSNADNPIALLFVDLDKFKQVNDTYGHQYGDFVLATAATRMKKTVRSNDMIGRYGGDEFLILLERVSKAAAYKVAEKISEVLSRPYIIDEQVIDFISGSIGISFCPQDGINASQLIEKSDTAMYRAKQVGKQKHIVLAEDFQDTQESSKTLRMELVNAIENDEFYLRIQPIVELQSARVIGGEVLSRWLNLNFDEVMPGTFIPLIHKMGISKKFDIHVLMKSIEALHEKKLPKDFFINVNFSSEIFAERDFVNILKNLLITHPWLQHHLVVEITESTMMVNIEQTSEYLRSIREMGLRVAIDDFGTGFSSLAYLKHFSIDYLKIDISFIENIEHSEQDKNIVKTIGILARAIGAKTIVEGIERESQYKILKELDIDYTQGFYFHKPLLPRSFFSKLDS